MIRNTNRLLPLSSCHKVLMSNFKKLSLTNDAGKLVEPASDLDYYTLFGFQRTFEIDMRELSSRFKELQKQVHPDKFAQADSVDLALSEKWAALINDGYKLLMKPLPRAIYILELVGYPLEENVIEMDPDFLSEIMELNEEVMEAGETEIKLLADRTKSKIEEYVELIDILITNEEYEKAREEVAHMKYYSNVLDKIFEKESEYGMY